MDFVATHEGLAAVRTEIERTHTEIAKTDGRIANLRVEVLKEIGDVKTEVADVKMLIANREASKQRWLLGITATTMVGMLALVSGPPENAWSLARRRPGSCVETGRPRRRQTRSRAPPPPAAQDRTRGYPAGPANAGWPAAPGCGRPQRLCHVAKAPRATPTQTVRTVLTAGCGPASASARAAVATRPQPSCRLIASTGAAAIPKRVHDVPASSGIVHPIVWVPLHGAVPICSKRSGPDETTGNRAIAQGTHYARAPGPASEPVTTPELWAPIIRRCVRHERQAILAALDATLRPAVPAVGPDATLLRWHEAARTAFLEAATSDPKASTIKRAHFQLSYRIGTVKDEELEMSGFVSELRQIGHEVQQLVHTGWPMFVLFEVPELRPRSVTDETSGVDEYLQCRLLGADRRTGAVPELWRVSPRGLATLVRAYFIEDFAGHVEGARRAPGTWLWPAGVARDLAELIRHALAFSQRFDAVEMVSFRAEWWGLKGRTLDAPDVPLTRLRQDLAEEDRCKATITVPVAELADGWPSVTATLVSSVLRKFNAEMSVSLDQIDSWSKYFRV